MATDAQTLFEETKCYACYGLSLPQLLKAGLLNRILGVTGSGSGSGSGSGAAVWGAITGTLSNQTDLQTALNAKTDLYTLTFYNSALSAPLDSTTYFLGQNGTASAAVQTTYNNVRVIVPRAGTIIAVTVNIFNETTNASGEAVTYSINKNNGTITALAPTTVWSAASSTLWSGLAIAVAQGDFLALQIVTPIWVTNPANTRLTANIIIQKT